MFVKYEQRPTKRSLETVGRAVRALEWLAEEGSGTAAALARHLGVGRSTAYTLLRSLESAEMVTQDAATKEFRLGWRLFELGQSVLRSNGSLAHVQPHLDELARRTGETALLAVREKDDALYVGIAEGLQSVRLTGRLGRRIPLHCSASGKVLLASLPDSDLDSYLKRPKPAYTGRTITDPARLRAEIESVRDRGWAACFGEWEISEASVSVPVKGAQSRLFAALTVGGPIDRFTEDAVVTFRHELKRTVEALESTLT